MKIAFHGADRNVTGSCHLLEGAGKRILIDCGVHQGRREFVEENAEPFGFEPAAVDYLLLTHAHLEHCGHIPLLAKRGFTGEVITTAASVELARLVLLDAAGLQEEEAGYRMRRARRQGAHHDDTVEPLYTTLDALNSLEYFGRWVGYDEPLQISPGTRATFIDAGHILGSACILLELEEDGREHRLLFSGDFGYSGGAILRNPTGPPAADSVVMETAYGDRLHKQLRPSIDELYDVVNTTVRRGGNVVIPTFALERAQEILYYLREGVESGQIDRFTNEFLDSPMAISATRIFERHPEYFDAEMLKLSHEDGDPFDLPRLRFTRETAGSSTGRITCGSSARTSRCAPVYTPLVGSRPMPTRRSCSIGTGRREIQRQRFSSTARRAACMPSRANLRTPAWRCPSCTRRTSCCSSERRRV